MLISPDSSTINCKKVGYIDLLFSTKYYGVVWPDYVGIAYYSEDELEHATKLARHLAAIEVDIETETK